MSNPYYPGSASYRAYADQARQNEHAEEMRKIAYHQERVYGFTNINVNNFKHKEYEEK